MSRRSKKKRRGVREGLDARTLGVTLLFYTVLFAVVGLAFGYLVVYDFILSGTLEIPLITWLPHYSFTTSMFLGVALSELILWPLLLLKPDQF